MAYICKRHVDIIPRSPQMKRTHPNSMSIYKIVKENRDSYLINKFEKG